jgi:hypothetical protein
LQYYWRNPEDMYLCDKSPYDPSEHVKYRRWFSKSSILYLESPGGLPNTYSSVRFLNLFFLYELGVSVYLNFGTYYDRPKISGRLQQKLWRDKKMWLMRRPECFLAVAAWLQGSYQGSS